MESLTLCEPVVLCRRTQYVRYWTQLSFSIFPCLLHIWYLILVIYCVRSNNLTHCKSCLILSIIVCNNGKIFFFRKKELCRNFSTLTRIYYYELKYQLKYILLYLNLCYTYVTAYFKSVIPCMKCERSARCQTSSMYIMRRRCWSRNAKLNIRVGRGGRIKSTSSLLSDVYTLSPKEA